MSFRAPLRVPVELRRTTRWFRLAHAVSVDGLALGTAVPDEVDGPIEVAFVLPGQSQPIRCRGRVEEVLVAEHAERRAVRFLDLDEAGRLNIQQYVEERLGLA